MAIVSLLMRPGVLVTIGCAIVFAQDAFTTDVAAESHDIYGEEYGKDFGQDFGQDFVRDSSGGLGAEILPKDDLAGGPMDDMNYLSVADTASNGKTESSVAAESAPASDTASIRHTAIAAVAEYTPAQGNASTDSSTNADPANIDLSGVVEDKTVPVVARAGVKSLGTMEYQNSPSSYGIGGKIGNKFIIKKKIIVVKGPPGPPGPKGDAGTDGKYGVDGKDGYNGKNGVDGMPGYQGEKGDTGDQGENGERGDKGDEGAKRVAGEKGGRGDRGEKGEAGDKGLDGTNGKDGRKGPKGDTGERGPRGYRGPRDRPGKYSRRERGEKKITDQSTGQRGMAEVVQDKELVRKRSSYRLRFQRDQSQSQRRSDFHLPSFAGTNAVLARATRTVDIGRFASWEFA